MINGRPLKILSNINLYSCPSKSKYYISLALFSGKLVSDVQSHSKTNVDSLDQLVQFIQKISELYVSPGKKFDVKPGVISVNEWDRKD